MKTRFSLFFCVLFLFMGCASLQKGKSAAGKVPASAAIPGPTLTEAQKRALQAIDDEAKKKAMPITLRFATLVKGIYENMLAAKPDEDLRAKLDHEMKETTWELLSIKGQAIRDSIALLTSDQKELVRAELSKPGAPSDLQEVIGKVFKPAGK